MIYGIGTDILLIDRVRRNMEEEDSPFIKKCFTEKEQKQALEHENRKMYYASHFCAKEAVFKTLNVEDIRLIQIEILNNANGKPEIYLYDEAERIATERNITEIQLSISYDTDYTVAFAVAVTAE